MNIHVHFFGIFHQLAKVEGQVIEIHENASVRELLDFLTVQYSNMKGLISREKIDKSNVIVVCGEKPVPDYQKKLTEGEHLYLFIMLAGG